MGREGSTGLGLSWKCGLLPVQHQVLLVAFLWSVGTEQVHQG